jgi:hypothetical protein
MAEGWLGPAFQLLQVHDTFLCEAVAAIANVATQPGPTPAGRL